MVTALILLAFIGIATAAPNCKTNAECLRIGAPLLRPRFKHERKLGERAVDCTASVFFFTGSLQECMIGTAGSYKIRAGGGEGGQGSFGTTGGIGALAEGDGFVFAAGTMIQVAVGGMPARSADGNGGGGAGGSFVYLGVGGVPANVSNAILVVGGGGGGSSFAAQSASSRGNDAPLPPDAIYSSGSGNLNTVPNGAANGLGGGGGRPQGGGGGGGVVLTNGGGSTANTADPPGPNGGSSLLNGLAGGTGNDAGNTGAYGGGGGGGYFGGGGGGGYSGGGGGGYTGPQGTSGTGDSGGGGGGSSFVQTDFNGVGGPPVVETYQLFGAGGNGFAIIELN